jgi:hypothetical protein
MFFCTLGSYKRNENDPLKTLMSDEMNQQPTLALVVAEIPKGKRGFDRRTNWQDFVTNVENNVYLPEGTQAIHDNIWLIQLSNGLPFLAEILKWSRPSEVTIRILFLQETPAWLEYRSAGPPAAEA